MKQKKTIYLTTTTNLAKKLVQIFGDTVGAGTLFLLIRVCQDNFQRSTELQALICMHAKCNAERS